MQKLNHQDVVDQITEVAEKPFMAIPLVLVGYVAAVGGIATGFAILCRIVCHP